MGRKVELAPPILTHAAIFSFFFRVEQDPAISTDLAATAVGAPAHFQLGRPTDYNQGRTESTSLSSKPVKTNLPVLASRIHDADFVRLASCVDPYSSRGLPPLRSRGTLAGSWEGRFSFFDFDSYKDMLGGRMRSLYDGPFGDQPQVWKLEEKVVRLREGEKAGGKGPALNAGYEIGQAGPLRSSTLSPPARHASLPAHGSRHGSGQITATSSNATSDRMEDVPRANKRARSVSDDDLPEDSRVRDEQEDEDGDYEILLTGSVSRPRALRALRRVIEWTKS